jgi:hypothetical protein
MLQALNSPNMWIGDTGTTKHSTKHKQEGINSRPSTSRTKRIYDQAVKPSMEVDLPGIYCDKSGEDQFAVKLQNINIILKSHYNLTRYQCVNTAFLPQYVPRGTYCGKSAVFTQKHK